MREKAYWIENNNIFKVYYYQVIEIFNTIIIKLIISYFLHNYYNIEIKT